MRLNNEALKDPAPWEKAGIELPRFDRNAMIQATKAGPEWVHFGAGNIFRAFLADLHQETLDKGFAKTGIIVAETYDGDIVDLVYRPYDNLSMAVTLKADGTIQKRVIASIAESLRVDRGEDFDRLKAVFRSPSLQMASFTITEKGYDLSRAGETLPEVKADFQGGPSKPASSMGKVAGLCYERYSAGKLPLALVSMDNCSHNGDKLFAAVEAFARAWTEAGLVESGFLAYIRDPKRVSFPWTMIDKITPQSDEGVKNMLLEAGCTDMDNKLTSKNTRVAPFVNAEEAQYLVIEDRFPAGSPALKQISNAGVFFTDRETVDKVERMKVCTCLNPLHTALAVFGCLLGYTKISEEMKNPDLVKLVQGIGYTEGLPVVVDPGILSPKAFIDKVLQVRFPNPFMPDTPQRIAADTSLKIPIRFGETIKAYLSSSTLKVQDLELIPLVLAGWIRYLLGVDDTGAAFTVSPDPSYASLAQSLSSVKLGQSGPFHEVLQPILSDSRIFAVNLYEAGLGKRVEAYFTELMAGPGAVARTLKRTCSGPSAREA